MALKYEYKAKDATGANKIGVVEASSLPQAIKIVQDNKLLLVNINEKKEFSLNSLWGGLNHVSGQELAQFTRLLSTMLSTGLPISDALNNLSSQSSGSYFKGVILSLLHDIQSGASISTAMSHYPAVFNSLYVNIVRSGEAAGKVDEALGKLADTLESQLEFSSKVKGALLYPAIIVIVMFGVGAIMMTAVIPKIAQVYKEFNADLPLPTKILVSVSDFMINDTIIVVLIVAALIVTYKVLRQNKSSDYIINNLMFKIPIIGPMNAEVEIAVMSRTLATLASSGVGIVDALKITAGTMGNNYYREGLNLTVDSVQKGLTLGQSFRNIAEFPIMIPQLVTIGEETGTVDQSLYRIAKFYQDSAERKVKTITTSLEPLLILLMGGAVGGLAIAVLLPIFSLSQVIH